MLHQFSSEKFEAGRTLPNSIKQLPCYVTQTLVTLAKTETTTA